MTTSRTGYFGRLLAALLGKEVAVAAPAVKNLEPSASEAALRGEAARLKMDLDERDQRIVKMQEEYKRLQVQLAEAGESAANDELERFFEKACKPLSSLAALADAAVQGHDVASNDLLQLIAGVMKAFDRAGLHRIGKLGEETAFDTTVHSRMSGGEVSEGTRVTICVPGYRTDRRVLLKAMVKSAESA